MITAQEEYASLVLTYGLSNTIACYQKWDENELILSQSKCDMCGTLGTEATSIAYPKKLCVTCGIAEQKRVFKPRPLRLPVPHTSDGHYVTN
jgi:hypothetical protein